MSRTKPVIENSQIAQFSNCTACLVVLNVSSSCTFYRQSIKQWDSLGRIIASSATVQRASNKWVDSVKKRWFSMISRSNRANNALPRWRNYLPEVMWKLFNVVDHFLTLSGNSIQKYLQLKWWNFIELYVIPKMEMIR